jgi:hypothetical protein
MQVALEVSQDLHRGITDTFHLVNTLRASTGLLTEGVARLVSAGANDKILEAMYSLPVGASGQNLRQFCTQSRSDQEYALTQFWLFAIIGHYEVWADSLPLPSGSRGAQFPSRHFSPNSSGEGYDEVFGSLTMNDEMRACYEQLVHEEPKYLGDRIDDALLLYRLYKECRNSLAHQGGRASIRVAAFGSEAAARAADLHVGYDGVQLPVPQFDEGTPVRLSFEQVRCFLSLLLRLMFTLDANLLLSEAGVLELKRRWQTVMGLAPQNVERRKLRRGQWVPVNFRRCNLPVPITTASAVNLLEAEGLVTFVGAP